MACRGLGFPRIDRHVYFKDKVTQVASRKLETHEIQERSDTPEGSSLTCEDQKSAPTPWGPPLDCSPDWMSPHHIPRLMGLFVFSASSETSRCRGRK